MRILTYRKNAKTRLHARHAENAKRMKLHVSKGDTVRVMRGDDKGKEGKVLRVFLKTGRVLVEGVNAGAKGWVAGLVNAYPSESVELFKLAQSGKREEVFALYRWFLPLLRMDTVPKFVQLIKWVQEQAGVGSAQVRAPRMELVGKELEIAQATFNTALATRPKVVETPFSSFKGA